MKPSNELHCSSSDFTLVIGYVMAQSANLAELEQKLYEDYYLREIAPLETK